MQVRCAVLGAAGGAVLSAITGGNAAQGAGLGAAAGATVGAVTADRDHRDYHDRRGYGY
ncbi:YMGG-like glycine zipper-containing protein [Paraburkholderia sp. LFS083]|uniref:YMGG-like glycine zipper-containing protein n=1 Tax=Paraburkholderia TaxID=1822464 RepID=UPI003A7FDA2F